MNKTRINLSFTSINSLGNACSVSLSRICSRNKNVVNKRNEGFGEENGDHVKVFNGSHWVDDRDLTDADSKKFNQY
ncbi:hypothetical protein D3H55_09215 [Bacillus salacetis]|uniref:Uncharacterized protein n=1 Tax=Bacillus salacetis TaxID=2315464 RepID=A0A3A1R5Q8_9BACI|nr:hypothetical protein [Bacillus salacetis]RIW34683.1 hypothetical protein D3H55_09215 [Bacillus salacetis]